MKTVNQIQKNITPENPVVCWWSGGITSTVACKLTLDMFGAERCRVVFIDTFNEDDDTYRFKDDCAKWYGVEIETITAIGERYKTIHEVWFRFNSLNIANGAICSSELKREVRKKWQNNNPFSHQVFGFDISEANRAKSMSMNYPEAQAIYPLLMFGMTKENAIEYVQSEGIEVPRAYQMGYRNNNCLKTGCVQGGIGYWQLIQLNEPEKFKNMAKVEHDLTDAKGAPVTMLRDQSDKKLGMGNVFLLPHPKFPDCKTLADMKGRPPEPLMECNGFGCAINDLMPKNPTENEINFQHKLFE